MNITMLRNSKGRGIAALIIIFMIGAAAFLMVYRAAFLGLGELDNSIVTEKGSEALYVTEGCLEEALRQLRTSPNYTGGSNMQVGSGSCTITVVPTDFVNRIITVTGKISNTDTLCKQIEARATTFNGAVTLISWIEKVNWTTPSC